MMLFGTEFGKLCNFCSSRGSPPTPTEIWSAFACVSRTIHRHLFSHIAKNVLGLDAQSAEYQANFVSFKASYRRMEMQLQKQNSNGAPAENQHHYQGQPNHGLQPQQPQQHQSGIQQLPYAHPQTHLPPQAHSPHFQIPPHPSQQQSHAQYPPHQVYQYPAPGYIPHHQSQQQGLQLQYRHQPPADLPPASSVPQMPIQSLPYAQQSTSVMGANALRVNTQLGNPASNPAQHHLPNRPPQGVFQASTSSSASEISSEPDAPAPDTTQTLLFPRENVNGARVTPAEPVKFAIHQAQLREPQLKLIDHHESMAFQFVSNFALQPQGFTTSTTILRLNFHISADDFNKRPVSVRPSERGAKTTRNIGPDSISYRLRCVKGTSIPDLSSWMEQVAHWPQHVYFEFNSRRLEPRRLLHYGRHLPIDLTDFVREGDNSLMVYSNMEQVHPPPSFAVAVECVQLTLRPIIEAECRARPFSISDMMRLLSESVTLADDSDDDDEILVSQMYVDLTDPIKISDVVETPVRGPHCRHRECFDLGSFLQTRPSSRPGEPSLVDVWSCPICQADARPSVLRLDKWLGSILDVLKSISNPTRRIMVKPDGSWKAVTTGGDSTPDETAWHLVATEHNPVGEPVPLEQGVIELVAAQD